MSNQITAVNENLRKDRLKWLKEHLIWDTGNMSIFFARQYIRRPLRGRNDAIYIRTSGGDHVMVGDFLRNDGRSKLVILDGKLNSENYFGLEHYNLLPDTEDKEFFQHDSAIYHVQRT